MLISCFRKKGFTLVEIMIVIAIIGIMAAFVGGNLQTSRKRASLEEQAQRFIGGLEEARSNSIGAKDGRSWGIRFNDSEYRLFSINTLGDDEIIRTESLPSAMEFSNSGRIVFTKLTGVPEIPVSIILRDDHFQVKVEVFYESIKKGIIEKTS